jgi:hydroxylamine reductase
MFCFQCEQTEGNKGCTVIGVCGKEPTTAALQDVLVHSIKGLSLYADACRKAGITTAGEVSMLATVPAVSVTWGTPLSAGRCSDGPA